MDPDRYHLAAGRILVRETMPSDTSAGGIVIPELVNREVVAHGRPGEKQLQRGVGRTGIVVAVGASPEPARDDDDDEWLPECPAEVGDVVVFERFAGEVIVEPRPEDGAPDGGRWWVLRFREVQATVDMAA